MKNFAFVLGLVLLAAFSAAGGEGFAATAARVPGGRGTLCLTFDDRNFGDWKRALPVFDRYGAHATFFVCGPLDRAAILAMRELRRHGHSLGLHGFGHASAVKLLAEKGGEGYLDAEVRPQLKVAASNGLKVCSWSYPFSSRSVATDVLLAKYFRHLRTGAVFGRDPKVRPLAECDELYMRLADVRTRLLFPSAGIGSLTGEEAKDVTTALERLARTDEVLVLYAHAILADGKGNGNDMRLNALEEILSAARVRNVRVLGFDEL